MLEQQLIQDRNELRLTKSSLSKANEELLKLNSLKSLFLSIAAHDLRSPLTAMRGYTDLAIKALSPGARSELDGISFNCTILGGHPKPTYLGFS
ncbi:MAG: hypothetical protein MZW92_67435 [Comamonadaceae bacterium]|nr:hypothetical protein [Comamonadaceae bacterium]